MHEKKKDEQPRLSLVVITNEDCTYNDTFLKETVDASRNIQKCLDLRDKYMFDGHQDYQYIDELLYKDDDKKWKIDFKKIEIKHKKVENYCLYIEDGVFSVKIKDKE